MGYTTNAVEISDPKWVGDFLSRDHLMPFPARLDVDAFKDALAVVVTLTANSAADDTTLDVTALTGPIPKGALLYFDGAKKFARVAVAAVLGAVSITVDAIPTALVSGDVARWSEFRRLTVPSGTVVGRTYAERNSDSPWGPAVVTDDEIFLIVHDVPDAYTNPDILLYRHGSMVKENYLPDSATLGALAEEVWTIAISGVLASGEFFVTDPRNGNISNGIAWNANAAAIDSAYEALFGTGDVAVTGTVAAHVVTFGGDLADIEIGEADYDISALVDADGVTVTRTTQGGSPLLSKLRELYACYEGKD